MASSLENLRVLDLSRVLAGPVCTQILGDLGAEVIKVERPGEGDDTRRWGPPFLKDKDGNDTQESAYYLSCNRNKKSVTIDLSRPEGQDIVHDLAARSDVLIHNFKPGSLEGKGLGFEAMQARHPHLIYAAISGFGQTGPLAGEPGYDLLAQAMGGLMAHTGPAGGEPMKAGVALVDVMTGLYTAIGILASLQARNVTGRGQMVDLALFDVTLASMTNLAQYYLTSGQVPARYGNAHATIVPYQAFAARDRHFVLAVGNDHQFRKLCGALGHPAWADDPRFSTNSARIEHRDLIVGHLSAAFVKQNADHWLALFREIDLPAAPVNKIDRAFAEEQAAARGMKIPLRHPAAGEAIPLVGSPLKLSDTPVSYRFAPPALGQDTEQVLRDLLKFDAAKIRGLKQGGII